MEPRSLHRPLERLVKTGFRAARSRPAVQPWPATAASEPGLRSLRPSLTFVGTAKIGGTVAARTMPAATSPVGCRQGAVRIAAGRLVRPPGWFDEQRLLDYLRDQGYRVKSLADAGAQ